ncbi:unnamed protein product [Darwinula stevensoni]|uniref:Uncharacterized protein n=1 Tax=Darwinula stevensoni TaxID=69355 RepID=A0A7R9A3H3_9CRUS|nr:unnamed protein product [Darwinula stevensoni]CAG0881311.1 unnamed protein product [Darwinula stevensoni]
MHHTLTGHSGKVMAAKFLEACKVVSGSHDRTLKVWDLRSRACGLSGERARISATPARAFKDRQLIDRGEPRKEADGRRNVRRRGTPSGTPGVVCFYPETPHPRLLFASPAPSESSTPSRRRESYARIAIVIVLIVTTILTLGIRTIFAGSSCNDVVTSDSSATNIISGHFDKRIRFWDSRSESDANQILLQGKVTSLDLSRDGKYLLTCVRDDTLKILDLRMNQVSGTFYGEGFKVSCDWSRAVFSPDSRFICCGSVDGSVFIWNVANLQVEKVLKGHTAAVIATAWNPNGDMLATCDKAKRVVIWTAY